MLADDFSWFLIHSLGKDGGVKHYIPAELSLDAKSLTRQHLIAAPDHD